MAGENQAEILALKADNARLRMAAAYAMVVLSDLSHGRWTGPERRAVQFLDAALRPREGKEL